jgi:hypothetical protein
VTACIFLAKKDGVMVMPANTDRKDKESQIQKNVQSVAPPLPQHAPHLSKVAVSVTQMLAASRNEKITPVIAKNDAEQANINKSLAEILSKAPTPYKLLYLSEGAEIKSIEAIDPMHRFSNHHNQPPHSKAMKIVTQAAFDLLRVPESKQLYDNYAHAKASLYPAIHKAAVLEYEIDTVAWIEAWKQAKKGNMTEFESAFQQADLQLENTIKLYAEVRQQVMSLDAESRKLDLFFRAPGDRAFKELAEKIRHINHINILNRQSEQLPTSFDDNVERKIDAERCTSWADFSVILTNHVKKLEEIKSIRHSKKPMLEQICLEHKDDCLKEKSAQDRAAKPVQKRG